MRTFPGIDLKAPSKVRFGAAQKSASGPDRTKHSL